MRIFLDSPSEIRVGPRARFLPPNNGEGGSTVHQLGRQGVGSGGFISMTILIYRVAKHSAFMTSLTWN